MSNPIETWRFPLDLGAAPTPGGPLVAGGTVYLATWQASGLVALDIVTGAERWRADVGQVVGEGGTINAATAGGVLYVVGTEGEGSSSDSAPPAAVHALDATTGQERWRHSLGTEFYATTPIVVRGLLVFTTESFDGHAVHAFDTVSGQERWTATLSPTLGYLTAVAADEGALYLAARRLDDESDGGTVLSLDAETGSERWRVDTTGPGEGMPTVVDGNVYVLLGGADPGSVSLHALDPATGAKLWTFDRDDRPTTPATIERTISIERVVASGDRVYLGVQEDAQTDAGLVFTNAVVTLDAATGSEQWRAVDVAFPVMAADVLYVNTAETQMDQSAEPAVVALDAVTGAEVWRYPGEIVIVLAAADGLVFVLAYGGLTALGSAP